MLEEKKMANKSQSDYRVLIIDDDMDFATSLKLILDNEDYSVMESRTSIDEALAFIGDAVINNYEHSAGWAVFSLTKIEAKQHHQCWCDGKTEYFGIAARNSGADADVEFNSIFGFYLSRGDDDVLRVAVPAL